MRVQELPSEMTELDLSAHNKLFYEGDVGKLELIKSADQRVTEKRLKELGVSQNKTLGTR